MKPPEAQRGTPRAAAWQDVEYGAYAADLPLWEELAESTGGPVLELGAGSGRVALHLARLGISTIALDGDPELIAELERRRGELPLIAAAGDLREVDRLTPARPEGVPSGPPTLAIAPLHVIQVLEPDDRPRALEALAAVLAAGARAALVIVDESTFVTEGVAGDRGPPDMREIEGWVYSSEPLWVQVSDRTLRVRRLRSRVSPQGEMERTVHDEVLHRISPEALEREATEAGLRPVGRRPIPSDGAEADSVAVILEAP